MQENYYVSIADIILQLETERPLLIDDKFKPFLIEETKPDFRVIFREVEKLPDISDEIIYEDVCYRVHSDGKGGFQRAFFDAPRNLETYAVTTSDYGSGVITVEYLEKGKRCVSELQNSFFHLCFEALLLAKKRLCLHAACVETPIGGLLFTGPSGIGKSTQATRWQEFRNARQINGDRPIIEKNKDGWKAWGSPYAGSSKCHVNDNCKITAIILLHQAECLTFRKLSLVEAFKAVWSGLTIHCWDENYVNEASDLALELIKTIPVFSFGCTPDEKAVDYLEQKLRKECGL